MSFEMLSFEMSFEMSAGRASVSVRTYTSEHRPEPTYLFSKPSRRARLRGHLCDCLFFRIIEYLIDPNT
jgi:hypothetical protein